MLASFPYVYQPLCKYDVSQILYSTSSRQRSSSLPDATLKLSEGQGAHAPADAPPQPLRYWPATHDEAEQLEQTYAPVRTKSQRSDRVCHESVDNVMVFLFVSHYDS